MCLTRQGSSFLPANHPLPRSLLPSTCTFPLNESPIVFSSTSTHHCHCSHLKIQDSVGARHLLPPLRSHATVSSQTLFLARLPRPSHPRAWLPTTILLDAPSVAKHQLAVSRTHPPRPRRCATQPAPPPILTSCLAGLAAMDPQADTSSGRYIEQWSFLTSSLSHDQARSLPPPSTYLRSDHSNLSPLPTALHFQHLNASRSSLSRRAQTSSIGGRSSTTIPSQPVLHRVHSQNVSFPNHPPQTHRPPIMDQKTGLPSLQEFTFASILSAIEEDIAPNVDAVAEILGRSRLVLADQHDSHLPPQGEIRGPAHGLHSVAEASSSNEHLITADDVLIAREDASLIDASVLGSAVYGYLDRLQVMPHTEQSHGAEGRRPLSGSENPPSPPGVDDIAYYPGNSQPSLQSGTHSSRMLLPQPLVDQERRPSRATGAVVSETFLSPSANALILPEHPLRELSSREELLFPYAYSGMSGPHQMSFRQRITSLVPTSLIPNMSSLTRGKPKRPVSAEAQLREILERHPRPGRGRDDLATVEERPDMYG